MKRVIIEDESKDEKERNKSNYKLNMLQLKPENLIGVALFENHVAFLQLEIAAKDHKLSDNLDIKVRGRHQEDLLVPDVSSSIKHNIIWEIGAFRNNERPAQQKLDALGHVKSHS